MAEETGDGDAMPQKCAVVGCCNRSDNKDRWVVMPHVTELSFHSCLDPEHLHIWTELITGGHRRLPAHACVCSNHFPLGRPCLRSPFPIVYLRGYEDVNEHITVRILRDTMNTDHDYPKLRYEEDGENPGGVLPVSCKEELEENSEEQLSVDSVPGQVCGVKDSGHCRNEQNESSKNLADKLSPSSAKLQPVSPHAGREEQCAAKLLQGKHQPVTPTDSVLPHSTENSTVVKEGRPFRGRKRRNSRDTDHIYNTRTSKSAKYSQVKNITDRRTDHQYNSRKVKTVENSCPQVRRNRYTDHMYNIPRTQLNELNNAAAASEHASSFRSEEKPCQETSAIVDKRVVDKDHMYQHSVRKNRNKVDSKNVDPKNTQMLQCAPSKKLLKHEGKNIDHRNEDGQAKLTVTKSENDLLPSHVSVSETGGRTSHLTRRSRKAWKGTTKKKKTSSASKDGGLAQDAGSDKAVMATSTVTASPDRSDNELDHVCEDDGLRTGVWQTDHMYVHLNTDILERKGEEPDLTPCFSIEGYKQEHSYANSVEIRYDACLNCSQLVQQLIGTIRQQGDHISDLKKKLYAANARNKQLTSLFSQKSENLE